MAHESKREEHSWHDLSTNMACGYIVQLHDAADCRTEITAYLCEIKVAILSSYCYLYLLEKEFVVNMLLQFHQQ